MRLTKDDAIRPDGRSETHAITQFKGAAGGVSPLTPQVSAPIALFLAEGPTFVEATPNETELPTVGITELGCTQC